MGWMGLMLACLTLLAAPAQATVVRLNTALGKLDIALYDASAPRTVANFLGYVTRRDFDTTFFHRSIPGFVLQGGGYTWIDAVSRVGEVHSAPPVANEFSPTRLNTRGTVAMARIGGLPDSATSEFFVNLAANSFLDTTDGGFTVFGRVTGPGMLTVDAFAALPTQSRGAGFEDLPVIGNPPLKAFIQRSNLAMVETAEVLIDTTEADRIFNYLEAAYPQYAPTTGISTTGAGYYYRYYAATDVYVGTANGQLYCLVPALGGQIQPLGSVAEWLGIAAAAGY